jgi:hypothetical protein
MGRTRTKTPTFRIQMTTNRRGVVTPWAWETKYNGRPTDATLLRYVHAFEGSTQRGGCNDHLGPVQVTYACVIRQSNGDVVASYSR